MVNNADQLAQAHQAYFELLADQSVDPAKAPPCLGKTPDQVEADHRIVQQALKLTMWQPFDRDSAGISARADLIDLISKHPDLLAELKKAVAL